MWPEDACLDTQWGEALWWHIQMHNGERTVTDITDVIQYHPKSSMSPMSPMSLMSPMTQMSPMSSNVRRHWVTFWHLVSLIYPIFHCLHATLMFMWCLLVVSVIMFKNQCDLKIHAWIFFGSWDAGHHFDLKYMGSKMRNVARIQLVRPKILFDPPPSLWEVTKLSFFYAYPKSFVLKYDGDIIPLRFPIITIFDRICLTRQM